MSKQILAIGARKKVLANLASTLHEEGFITTFTTDLNDVLSQYKGSHFDVITFGRIVKEPLKQEIKAAFKQVNPEVKFVDGLAPVINLLVAQIYEAFNPTKEKIFKTQSFTNNQLEVYLNTDARLVIKHYWLRPWFQSGEKLMFDQEVKGDKINIPVQKKWGRNFIAIQINETETYAFEI